MKIKIIMASVCRGVVQRITIYIFKKHERWCRQIIEHQIVCYYLIILHCFVIFHKDFGEK